MDLLLIFASIKLVLTVICWSFLIIFVLFWIIMAIIVLLGEAKFQKRKRTDDAK